MSGSWTQVSIDPMRIGDVLRKEREGRTGLHRIRAYDTAEMAQRLGIAESAYVALERGDSPVERWFPLLCSLAVSLGTPAARLLAPSGRFEDCAAGLAGPQIQARREACGLTIEEIAGKLGVPAGEYVEIERGTSPIETYGPLMLRFAEIIEQPVFNLFMPCGIPHDQLDDYP